MLTVRPLDTVGHADRPEVGGKAVGLGLLASSGLPVAAGFVLPTTVFQGALRAAGLWEAASQEERRPGGEALGAKIEAMAWPAGSREALVEAARALGDSLAVRSSAVDEDGRTRSFAGQYRTELGVAPEEVPEAVLRCWASLYDASVRAYRGQVGPRAGSMAVVVQRMVYPSVAGVLFTINPLNGSWREMVVEAVRGQGEGLVSGRIAPHWYLVRRPHLLPRALQRLWSRVRLQWMQEDLPRLSTQWVLDGRGELREEPVPEGLRDLRTLEVHEVLRLCRLGLRVEALLGAPQDVEWARDPTGRFVLLQARPITSTGTPRVRRDVLWTRRFIGERWPEPATPLGWSIMGPLLEHFIAYPGVQARYLGGGPAVKLVGGRPYLNTTVFRHLAFKLPGAPVPSFMLELVPPEEEAAWRRRHAVLPDLAVYASLIRTTVRERRWERFRANPLTNHRAWLDYRARLEAALPTLSRPAESPAQGVRQAQAQIEMVRDYIAVHICSLLFAHLFYQLLDGALAAWAPDRRAEWMAALATCPPGNLTLQTNAAHRRLAARGSEAEILALGEGILPDPGSDFGEALDGFLQEYGHRSESSWEVWAPRWRDRPERLAPLLAAQRAGGEGSRERSQEADYEAARREVEAAFGRTGRGAILAGLIRYTRIYLLLRENQRYLFDQLLAAMQKTLRGIGESLAQRGVLADAEEIAFLTMEEVTGLVEGTLPAEAAPGWVRRRRAARETAFAEEPPVFLSGEDPAEPGEPPHRMQGLGISPGRVRGRVRVVRSVLDGRLLQPGEVLVARSVDPGWTPLFLVAGAVVLELGSVLSHGAVVAREYKVPAVVNLEGVTRQLVDGQEVTVDGTRGVLWVHP